MKKSIFWMSMLASVSSCAAADDGGIVPFTEQCAISASALYTIASFGQGQLFEYSSDIPWALGLGVRYKTISAGITIPVLYTSGGRLFESFDIRLASYNESFYYEAFCRSYQDFSCKDGGAQNGERSIDLSIFSTGISAAWILNNARHSLSAVYDLDSRQGSSSGSALLGFGMYYTSIKSADADIQRYRSKQHCIYAGPSAGYSYTFVFSGGLFLNLNLVAGIDAGINAGENRLLFVPLLMPKLAFGYHGATWSANIIAGCTSTSMFWDTDSIDTFTSAAMSVTFSKRL